MEIVLYLFNSVDILPAGTVRVLHSDASLWSCNVGPCIGVRFMLAELSGHVWLKGGKVLMRETMF